MICVSSSYYFTLYNAVQMEQAQWIFYRTKVKFEVPSILSLLNANKCFFFSGNTKYLHNHLQLCLLQQTPVFLSRMWSVCILQVRQLAVSPLAVRFGGFPSCELSLTDNIWLIMTGNEFVVHSSPWAGTIIKYRIRFPKNSKVLLIVWFISLSHFLIVTYLGYIYLNSEKAANLRTCLNILNICFPTPALFARISTAYHYRVQYGYRNSQNVRQR